MGPEITFIVAYPCPRCQAALEVRSGQARDWVRCPKCGRPSLPPEHVRAVPNLRAVGEDVLIIGPDPDPGPNTRPFPPAHSAAPEVWPFSPRSVLFGVGFIFTLILGVVSYIDPDWGNPVIYGALSLVFLVLWLFPPRRR